MIQANPFNLGISFYILFRVYDTLDLIIIVMMSYLIVKELRSPYTDYLIILQYWSIWITFVYFISESIILTISSKALNNFWYWMVGSFWGTPLLYYIFNQLSWYILIQHLKYTRLLARQTSYDTIKSYIRKQEMGAILFVVLFSVVWLCIIIVRNYFMILRRYRCLRKKWDNFA